MARSQQDALEAPEASEVAKAPARKSSRKSKPVTQRQLGEGRTPSKQVYGIVLLSTVLVLLGVLLYLWPQMRIVELGYQQSALRSQQTKIVQRQKELGVELASLRRLDRIEQIAVNQLGMRAPQLSQVIYLREEQKTVSARTMP